MKKNIVAFGALLVLAFSVFNISCTQNQSVTSFQAMNTFMSVKAYGKNSEAAAVAVQKRVEELESYLSTTNQESDVYNLNHNQKASLEIHPETYNLVRFALNIAESTGGALNPVLYPVTSAWGFTTGEYRVPSQSEIDVLLENVDFSKVMLEEKGGKYFAFMPDKMMLDLGAVGKGYAGDEAIKILKENGITSALLDFGGNVQTLGLKPDKSEWKIGIKNPWDGSVACGISVSNKCVITSGGYERFFTADDGKKYIHIFDGKTGYPVMNDVASTTIVCQNGIYGDALSTAMFVMGAESSIKYWKQHRDFDLIVITNENQIFYTTGLKGKIQFMHHFDQVTLVE